MLYFNTIKIIAEAPQKQSKLVNKSESFLLKWINNEVSAWMILIIISAA